MMPDTDAEAATGIAERLRIAIETEPFVLPMQGRQITVTASMGIATLTPQVQSPEQLLKQADQALYEAKHGGRNRVVAAAA